MAGAEGAGLDDAGAELDDVDDAGVQCVSVEDAQGEDGAESASSAVEVEGAVAEAERNTKASGVPSAWRRRL